MPFIFDHVEKQVLTKEGEQECHDNRYDEHYSAAAQATDEKSV